ncbi:ATP-dependent endonuclease [Tetragenococcus koreensis]|uniref:AAA family ATPase n=1 Tax=Tetragenococcus koreensis TaxID=290335 RepID=UPI001F471D12|nr:ATP-dependent endonuclease [Tetragenococcus koreensis]MCF1586227.1 ATP-dependent endonuclease [Tetragenococcus koreensis]MCF1630487.1 ATP-dependent endonuclease [Tetragenococcus koreensis]
MKIHKVRIENFRLLKDFELDFREEISLIVGKNNCGKTSVLTIMDKFLSSGDISFSWNDFNLDFQKEFYEKLFEREVSEVEYNFINNGIRMQLFIDYNESDNYINIQSLMMDLNPRNNSIVLEFIYTCKEDMLKQLRNDLNQLKINTFEEFSNFMNKNSSRYFKVQRYSRRFDFDKKEATEQTSGEFTFSEIKKLINFRSIKANREASNKANDHSLSSLSQKYHNINSLDEDMVITELQKTIQVADQNLNETYNGTEEHPGIFNEVFESVRKFGSDADISIQSTISEMDLLKNNTTLYYKNDNLKLPESYNGLGYLNLIGMIFEIEMIISEFHRKLNEKPADINLLFIEEPEAHTHPQLQYVFIKNIKDLIKERVVKNDSSINIQTLITTHSSHVVSECDFSDVRYLVRKNNKVISKNFQELQEKYETDKLAFKFVKQYLNQNRSELFFTDKVIFIEGDTERILLPAMMQKIDKIHEEDKRYLPLLSQNISIIEVGAYAYKFKPLIDFLDIEALIITDVDGVEKNGGSSCASKHAKFTSNFSLRDFFNLPNDDRQFSKLTRKSFNEKAWGNTRIAYQTEIPFAIEKYQPRSFEDAFICQNFIYTKKNKNNFEQGLKKRNLFERSALDFYEISQECVAKKSAFASEILYYDGFTEGETWVVPDYIKEGLEWLQKK